MAAAATDGLCENKSADYFQSLFGFPEFTKKKRSFGRSSKDGRLLVHSKKTYKKLQSMFKLSKDETKLTSLANQREFYVGSFRCASPDELVIDVMAQGLMADWSNKAKNSCKFRQTRTCHEEYEVFLPSPKCDDKRLDFCYGLFDRDLLERERCPLCAKRLLKFVQNGRKSIVNMMSQFDTIDGKQVLKKLSQQFDGDTFTAKQMLFKELRRRLVEKYQNYFNLDRHLLCKACSKKPPSPTRKRKDSLLHESAKSLITHFVQKFEAFDPSLACIIDSKVTLPEPEGKTQTFGVSIGSITLRHVATTGVMHQLADPENRGALFQVASQFNTLEFLDDAMVPENGVGMYIHDPTQGPRCAIACAPALVHRTYLYMFGNGRRGQRRDRQLNNLSALHTLLGKTYFTLKNGYLQSTREQLTALNEKLSQFPRRLLLDAIKVGLVVDAEVVCSSISSGQVTMMPVPRPGEDRQIVTQVYCSAVSCTSKTIPHLMWQPLAKLILDASYECLLWTGVLNAKRNKTNKVFLTSVGGGVFNNKDEWIADAIARAIAYVSIFVDTNLELVLSHYRRVDKDFVVKINQACKDELKFVNYLQAKHKLSRICASASGDDSARLCGIFRVNQVWEQARAAFDIIPQRDEKLASRFEEMRKQKFVKMLEALQARRKEQKMSASE